MSMGARGRARMALALGALLVALAGCASPPGRRSLEVRMRYSRYLPARLDARVGETIVFRVVNLDPIAHEFVLGTAAEQEAHERGPADDPHDRPGEARIGPFETATVTYTFSRPGPLLYACHQPGHYRYGMRGEIRVSG
jgi:uncharacterized cupredoxin-like copper-binding protein